MCVCTLHCVVAVASFDSPSYPDAERRTMSQSVSESVSLVKGYPYAALYNVRASEIQAKVNACSRDTWFYYTKVILEIKYLL